MSTISTKSSITSSSEEYNNKNELRRGPWTMEEDALLIHYISCHGEGRWNLLAKSSGLRRNGKSCRLRWLNYLKPDVKRGNLTPEEQLLILDLHSKWGNRWSKIAQYLPGRTDNEIKNYWRTRVQKQAKHLKIDAESAAFQDIIRRFWMPRLIQKIEGHSSSSTSFVAPNVKNPIVPIPIDNTSQPQLMMIENPMNMSSNNMSTNEHSSDSELSMNMPHISHFSKYPNSPFHQEMVSIDNNINNSTTFLEGCSNGPTSENYGNEIDVFSHTSTSFSQPKGVDNHVGGCHVAGGDWADNDFFGTTWTMDELWQYRT